MKQLLVGAISIFFLACTDAGSGSTDTGRDTSKPAGSDAVVQESKEDKNKQTALASIEGIKNRSADVVFSAVDSSAVDYGEGSMPPIRNLDSMKMSVQSWLEAFPDYKVSDMLTVADGDYVIVYGTWTGTWKNDFMGMKATGKSFKVNDADIFKFNDAGKIIEHRSIQSLKTIAMQIGMKMPG